MRYLQDERTGARSEASTELSGILLVCFYGITMFPFVYH